MGVVAPIKDREKLEKMKSHLKEKNFRDYLLFRVGTNLGLSIQELLHLRVEDVTGKDYFFAGKYGVKISSSLQKELEKYIGSQRTGYLFGKSPERPLSRFQLYKILREAANAVKLEDPVGAMTLRKTFVFWAYKNQSIPLPMLSKYLQHHTIQYTLQYINAVEDENTEIYLPEVDL